ncbi:hypothetical protein [Burkholderia lata]|uniref:Uncharacterized protein n=1 Tax=Burkholderia lata (strain ATCC 17760 / DSM 23089 / LMG 22485 / NCIMB 9086 / R18194 / 383) TaxID=482957 RepID=Q39M53_BURL3|nr:hypothetical protein [Burkholderia lata]ABB06463.1 hypothetical protein Bcep18194_C7419 [Burkholderia lata]
MVRPVHFTYRIERDAQQPVAVAASAYRMPLDTPADYARAALAESAGNAYDAGDALGGDHRVLLDHVQYFAFLADITTRIRDVVHPDARVFIEVCAPYFGALPAELLAPHVLLGVHLYDEALRDAARGAPVVWIGDRILRDAEFAGDNRVCCAIWPARLADAFDAQLRGPWPSYAIRLDPHPATPRGAPATLTDSAHHSGAAAQPGRP